MRPDEVMVGRTRHAWVARAPYREALQESEAGRIDLERGERPEMVKRYLSEAAREVGVRVRSSTTNDQRSIFWKRVGKRVGTNGT